MPRDGPDPQKWLLAALDQAHHSIRQRALQDSQLSSMGTTCTAFATVNARLYFVDVGDSRLYLSGGKLQLLSRDHTLIARLLENKLIGPDQAQDHPQKHVLTSALGVLDQEMEIDAPAEPMQLYEGDVLMYLCGRYCGAKWSLTRSSKRSRHNPRMPPVRRWSSLLEIRGGPDNITLQVLHII